MSKRGKAHAHRRLARQVTCRLTAHHNYYFHAPSGVSRCIECGHTEQNQQSSDTNMRASGLYRPTPPDPLLWAHVSPFVDLSTLPSLPWDGGDIGYTIPSPFTYTNDSRDALQITPKPVTTNPKIFAVDPTISLDSLAGEIYTYECKAVLKQTVTKTVTRGTGNVKSETGKGMKRKST